MQKRRFDNLRRRNFKAHGNFDWLQNKILINIFVHQLRIRLFKKCNVIVTKQKMYIGFMYGIKHYKNRIKNLSAIIESIICCLETIVYS